MQNWTLDQLKNELNHRSQVKGWIILQEHVHRRERYFLANGAKGGHEPAIDQDRETHIQNVNVRIFVNKKDPSRQGEVLKKFSTAKPLASQVDSAVEAALQTDHQRWELPSTLPSEIPVRKTTDPRIAEDIERAMTDMTNKISRAVSKSRQAVFNSAELFLSSHDFELQLSNGLVHRSSQSRAYVESAFSATSTTSKKSDEYMTTSWSVNLDDLKVDQILNETADHAEHIIEVKKPEIGTFSVIIDADVLCTLLNGHLAQLSGIHAYHKLPFLKPGDELIPNATGDLLSLKLDPALDFGANTTAISEQGIIQAPLQLVESNRVLSTALDQQYASYLKELGGKPTTVRGNLVVSPGKMSHHQLTQAAPKVIEILQFSGLFADVNSGTFSSEIRLAKLYDNKTGTVTYLKGGSLSGSITENFKNARLSNQLVKRAQFSSDSAHGQGYYGPSHVLLNDVSIVG